MPKYDDSSDEKGIPCPSCGCCYHKTIRTTRAMGEVQRQRKCRHCGRKFTTKEKVPK